MTAPDSPAVEQRPHVIDRNGHVWAVVRDGGMVTRADYRGVKSAGIAWLEREAGPLLPFDPITYRRDYPQERVMTVEQRPTDRDTLREALWETIAEVRDQSPRLSNDADTYDIADALLAGPLADVLARLDAAEAKVRAVEGLAEDYAFLGATLHNVPKAETFSEVAEDLRAALAAGAPEGGRR